MAAPKVIDVTTPREGLRLSQAFGALLQCARDAR